MGLDTDIAILSADFRTQPLPFRSPLKFGGRIVDRYEVMEVRITVQNRRGGTATGYGSMPIGHVWAWPTQQVPGDLASTAIKQTTAALCQRIVAPDHYTHPLYIMHELRGDCRQLADAAVHQLQCPEPMPELAVLLAASPVDAAIHDAFGRVNQINAFRGLSREFVADDLAYFLTPDFAGDYLDQYVLATPKATMPLYHLVGALDPVRPAECEQPIGDGLPETLGDWILADGLTHLKIKLSGDQADWDFARIVAVEEVAQAAHQAAPPGRLADEWFYSLDFNERCADVSYILELLARLRQEQPSAYARIQYLEQPTHRDLAAHPEHQMHPAAAIKPVVIDESLVDLTSLQLARQMGYSGVALKACKGQTESLLMAAAAQKYQMFLCVQDLTCPGASFLHSAALAAWIPPVAAIEGNSRQYCPAGNNGWRDRYPSLFEVRTGSVGTAVLTEVGLGFSWPTFEE